MSDPSYYEQMRLTLMVQLHELIDVADRMARRMHKMGDTEERDCIQGAIDYARKVSKPYNYNGTTPPFADGGVVEAATTYSVASTPTGKEQPC